MGDEEKKKPDDDEPIGDEKEEEEGEAAAKAPKKPFALSPLIVRILTISIGVIVVIIVAVVTSIIVTSLQSGSGQVKAGIDDEMAKEDPPKYYEMGDFNLNTSDKDVPHFVKIKITFAYDRKFEENKKFVPELGEWKQALRDIIGRLLSEKSYNELQDAEIRKELREEIKNEINKKVKHGEVSEVLFDDFLLN